MRVLTFLLLFFCQHIIAQETVYPAPAHKGSFWITNATIHVGLHNICFAFSKYVFFNGWGATFL